MAKTKKINLAQLNESGSADLGELQSSLEGIDKTRGKDSKKKNKVFWTEDFSAKGKKGIN